MKFYTKQGDAGDTRLADGRKIRKSSLRVAAYGDVDELNSLLGWVRSQIRDGSKQSGFLEAVQNDLFVIGADLASPQDGSVQKGPRLNTSHVRKLEKYILKLSPSLPTLKNFVVPRGHPLAAAVHWARAVCRRAERAAVTLSESEPVSPDAVVYLNRLSSLLFVLALHINKTHAVSEKIWKR